MANAGSVPTYELYGEDDVGGAQFWVHCETIPARSSLHHWEIGMHRHADFLQILSVTRGSGDAVFGEEIVRFEPFSVITVPPGVAHGFRFSPDVDGHVVTVLRDRLVPRMGAPGWMGGFLDAPRVTRLPGDADHASGIAATVEHLALECETRRAGWSILVESAIASVLTLTARAANIERLHTSGGDINDARLDALLSLMQRHVRQHQPISYFAKALGVTPTHLNRIVKAKTGRSTQSLLAAHLLEEAQRELLFTAGSLQEIAYRLGFADPAYFSRFFLRQTGMTPRHWKSENQQRLGTRMEI